MRTHARTHMHTHARTCTHARMHAHTHTHAHTCRTHTCRTCMHAPALHSQAHPHMRTRTHTCCAHTKRTHTPASLQLGVVKTEPAASSALCPQPLPEIVAVCNVTCTPEQLGYTWCTRRSHCRALTRARAPVCMRVRAHIDNAALSGAVLPGTHRHGAAAPARAVWVWRRGQSIAHTEAGRCGANPVAS
jgi:hypothetical protein